MIKLGINGYGRIGRNLHRITLENPDIEVVAVNSRAPAKMRAHLLKYDSLHGPLPNQISADEDSFTVDGKKVASLSVKNAEDIPWSDYGVDIVLESTGNAKTKELAEKHLGSGVRNVLVSAPMKDDTPTFVFGVNEEGITKDIPVMSNASCTTNCIAPTLMLISEQYGIENAFVTSIHSFTNSQNLLDNSGRDLRRARSAVENIIPTTTGSIAAIGKIIPKLLGKIDGLAFRIPTPTVSICDMRLVLESETTAEELNDFLRTKCQESRYQKFLGVSDEELVSMDFRTDFRSGIVDATLTKVLDKKYVQLQIWYDNEWGYAARLVDFLEKLK
jgi:glyceraldehyde 3-phosphate dehydrogenase